MAVCNLKQEMRLKRKKRIRGKIAGTSERPRLTVFRTAKHIYAQIINDEMGISLVSASTLSKEIRGKKDKLEGKVNVAVEVGKLIAAKALAKGIKKVVFDRCGFLYHGRVKALSNGAREGGLDF
ncbi:MAG: 50S ribosomal protein L18 [Deltaproteobacteria bacterium]|jgi:large subunit ribosomal protein L18|nr:50S ribosomal protein L18 [Deltaproteobacteria bacterium]MDP3029279.1 50S ribosomal protein L18 [Deltaproteobacteria bacterium]TSA10567.1 MAG: 50S ribosomal protein L18 [Deltaproteobacteria bacterium]